MISKNMDNLTLCFILTLSHLIYMYTANYVGQKIIDHNNELFKLM